MYTDGCLLYRETRPPGMPEEPEVGISSFEIRIKGKGVKIPSCKIGNNTIIVKGRSLKMAEIFDEYWLEPKQIPDPKDIIETLKGEEVKPDIFTFTQKFPDISPRYPYRIVWDNLAVAEFDSYQQWLQKINKGAKSSLKKSIRENVRTEIVEFTDELVQGISAIYNESPVRQGKSFWHYGKDLAAVKSENGTYLERSVFIGAFYGDEFIGFIKLVCTDTVALIMQILSKTSHFAKCPTNSLLAKAVEICVSKRIKYLVYAKYDYGTSRHSSLTDFKHNNGFVKVNIPRYYVPITLKGNLALKLGLHKDMKDRIPRWLKSWLLTLRLRWHSKALKG
jgi:hypothetical protein